MEHTHRRTSHKRCFSDSGSTFNITGTQSLSHEERPTKIKLFHLKDPLVVEPEGNSGFKSAVETPQHGFEFQVSRITPPALLHQGFDFQTPSHTTHAATSKPWAETAASLPRLPSLTTLPAGEFLVKKHATSRVSANNPDFPFQQNTNNQRVNLLNMQSAHGLPHSLSKSPESPNMVPNLSGTLPSSSSMKREMVTPTATAFDNNYRHAIPVTMAKALNIDTGEGQVSKGLADLLSPVAIRNTGFEKPLHSTHSYRPVSLLAGSSADSQTSSQPSTPTSATSAHSPLESNDAWLLNGQTKRTEQLMKSAFADINDTCKKLSLDSTIVESAKQVYWAAKSQNLCRGKANDALAGASVYFSCRQEGTPRTFFEIASASTSNKRDIGRCYKILEKFLKTKSFSKMTVEDMIGRICAQLTFENAEDATWIQQRACLVARSANENNLVASKSPLSVAATAVFMVVLVTNPNRQRITRDMAKASGVSEVTLRNVYREFYSARQLLMPTCETITQSDIQLMPSLQGSNLTHCLSMS